MRDIGVTGVQTCALPISMSPSRAATQLGLMGPRAAATVSALVAALCDASPMVRKAACTALAEIGPAARRSEERRVGKESRAGSPPGQAKHRFSSVDPDYK